MGREINYDKPKRENVSFYPLPPPDWFDGKKFLESVQQVVEIDEETGMQKITIIKQ